MKRRFLIAGMLIIVGVVAETDIYGNPAAAAQIGHSVKVHCEIYHAWINEDIHKKAYQVLMANPNRPKPLA